MHNRVTIKILAATAFAITVITFSLLMLVWQWQTSNAQRMETDYSRQVENAVAHANPALLAEDPDTLREIILNALPSNIHLQSMVLHSPGSKQIVVWSAHDQGMDAYSAQDNAVADFANIFSALPDDLSVNCPSEIPATAGMPAIESISVVLDMREQKMEDAYLMAEVIQIFFPITLMCMFGVYCGVQLWVQRPANAIIRVARRIAGGDRELRLAITTRDEFGEIMRAFNDLTDALLTTQQQADTDGLTQVFNHRYLQEKISESLDAARLAGRSMAIILIDLNKFKLLNDTYGHLVGDLFLQQTAGVLRRAVHLDGIVGRYGGDEFLIVIPHAGQERAQQAARRIRALMDAEQFRPIGVNESLPLSFSMGVAVYPENGHTAKDLIAYADAGLYSQKQGGYNLVELTRDIEQEYASIVCDATLNAQSGGLFATLFSLVAAVDTKDAYTKRHSVHVADWAVRLGQAVGLPAQTLRVLQLAGLLHDVGKIGVPDSVLRKPGPLSDQEQEIMAGHVALSERLIQEVPYQDEVIEAVSCHHERWDGHGYPRGRTGPQMPLVGRIMSLVDAYSAMCLDRPYRRAMSAKQVCKQLREGAGTQFDPDLVDVFVKLIQSQDQPETNAAGETSPEELAESTRRSVRKLPDAA